MKITANIKGLRWQGIEFPRDGYSRECTEVEIRVLKTVPLCIAVLKNANGDVINKTEEVQDAHTNIGHSQVTGIGSRKRRKN